ncbi:hypothetical protein P9Z75_26955 [Bacillus tropicus]|uniref:hypothetical protein n=1 Tax=Bacillus tropicus TaxID=2026188 RepID=UPI002DB8538E|nr:hypothetical protein [Bacillus tropicus]MEC3127231.1 hypothetical protein [Bacillus tropicus]
MNLPDYQSFLSGQRLEDFWQIVKWLLFFVAPVVMIVFALNVLSEFYQMIVKVVRGSNEEKESADDYEVYHYEKT